MAFRLTIDQGRWQEHLDGVLRREPGLVPVVKGRGYGLGTALLARRAERLGVDTVAVGTPAEAQDVLAHFSGDAVVLEPWSGADPAGSRDTAARTVRTVGNRAGLTAVLDAAGRGDAVAPFLVEVDSSMHRHGVPVALVARQREALAALAGTAQAPGPMRGFAVHLPVRGAERGELERVATTLTGAGWAGTTLWVSHSGAALLREVSARVPALRLRERVGTRLWLGDRGALRVTGQVLDVHEVTRGTRVGYARWRARTSTVVVVSGGTAHGVGLSAEPAGTLRGGATGIGLALAAMAGVRPSPFTLAGRRLRFADTPHMQVSMLALPKGLAPPDVGDAVACQVRYSITTFDDVVESR